jgi:hypothetical protein
MPIMALAIVPISLAATRASADPAKELQGRYYTAFQDALITGETYLGENIVEIVPVRRNAAYVRIHLDYYNGHSCGIFGIAGSIGETLVYRDPKPQYDGTSCALSLKREGGSLLIDDHGGSCSAYCGARGSLSKVRLPYRSKRPIRYLARLKSSSEYRQAVAEWMKGKE